MAGSGLSRRYRLTIDAHRSATALPNLISAGVSAVRSNPLYSAAISPTSVAILWSVIRAFRIVDATQHKPKQDHHKTSSQEVILPRSEKVRNSDTVDDQLKFSNFHMRPCAATISFQALTFLPCISTIRLYPPIGTKIGYHRWSTYLGTTRIDVTCYRPVPTSVHTLSPRAYLTGSPPNIAAVIISFQQNISVFAFARF